MSLKVPKLRVLDCKGIQRNIPQVKILCSIINYLKESVLDVLLNFKGILISCFLSKEAWLPIQKMKVLQKVTSKVKVSLPWNKSLFKWHEKLMEDFLKI